MYCVMTEEKYMEDRVNEQCKYFSKKAYSNKKNHYTVSIIKLIISLAITIVSSVMGDGSIESIVIAVLSALLALIEGVLLLFRFPENWITYRMTSEQLKREKFLFEAKAGEYYNIDNMDAYNLFVQNVEGIILNCNKEWKEKNNSKRGE